MNSASVQSGDGGMCSASSFLQDQIVDEVLPCGTRRRPSAIDRVGQGRGDAAGGDEVGVPHGDGRLAVAGDADLPVLHRPSATRSSLLLNLAQRVTSSAWPSEYQARTTICSVSFGLRTAAGGKTSRRLDAGVVVARRRGAPEAIQSARS